MEENGKTGVYEYTITRCVEGGYIISSSFRYREQGFLFASTTVAEALEFIRTHIETGKANA